MGRKATTTLADKYFDQRQVPCENRDGLTTESTCNCCSAPGFRAITGTKRVAHLLGIPNQGIAPCSHSLIRLSDDEILALADSTKAGKEWKERGAGKSHPLFSKRPSSQPQGARADLIVLITRCV
jgi:hypothetical protein